MSGKFIFPYRRVLDWHRQTLAAEQLKLEVALREVREIDQQVYTIEHRQYEEQEALQGAKILSGPELQSLAHYVSGIRVELARLRADRARKQARASEQRQTVTAAHRRVRLFEKLEDRRREEWVRASALEESSLTADLYLASIVRSRSAARSGSVKPAHLSENEKSRP